MFTVLQSYCPALRLCSDQEKTAYRKVLIRHCIEISGKSVSQRADVLQRLVSHLLIDLPIGYVPGYFTHSRQMRHQYRNRKPFVLKNLSVSIAAYPVWAAVPIRHVLVYPLRYFQELKLMETVRKHRCVVT